MFRIYRTELMLITLLSFLYVIISITFGVSAAETSNWVATTSLPYPIASQAAFSLLEKIYLVGGSAVLGGSHDEVLRTDVMEDGVLSEWTTISHLPKKLIWHSITNNQDYVYVLGGFIDSIDGISADVNSVFGTKIYPDGSLGSWQTLSPLPQTLSLGKSAIIENRIFYAGGDTDSHQLTSTMTKEVYRADINLSDGTIGPWTLAGTLPQRMIGFNMIEVNNYLYIFGGYRETGVSPNVERAYVDPTTGNIGSWQSLAPFPKPIWASGLTRVGNTIVNAGGHDGALFSLDVYYSNINPDGTISNWQASTNILPRVNVGSPLVAWNEKLYLTGGHDGANYFDSVYFTNIYAVLGNTAPTPSPTPTPIPITKVFFVPGLGASWNADAFANCTSDDNPDNWSLASYAEDIYNPIIQTLTDSGWATLPFYYDWRRIMSTNSESLANYINGHSTEDEKVNLVGHSMGGLVGRGYLEASDGGRLSNLLTVGTPNKGSALAYPPWEGGDIWNDNFIEKIALTLYLKHCGGLKSNDRDTIQKNVPSLQDLLPIEPYLQENNTTTLYLPDNPENQNTWLKNLPDDSQGVRLGYVVGTGFDTLKTIRTKDPNKRDSKLGNWEDGKPAGKIFSSDGDGIVLADSAILPNADISYPINQTHEGLINSVEGMSKILEFLGTPQISNQQELPSNTSEANSALIIIADPANFIVTDQNGKTKSGKDGMVSFINPESGNYKLNLLPKSNNTLFIVAQFLPNGDVRYKEYNLSGLGPKFKTLKFDLQNPQEDILNP